MLIRYTTNEWPVEYVPTVFDNYSAKIAVDGTPVTLDLLDWAGREDGDRLRPLSYPGTDVHVLCFSIVSEASLKNIEDRWLPIIRESTDYFKGSTAPVVLVGTMLDLRTNETVLRQLGKKKLAPISYEQGAEFARKIGAVAYRECSALTGEGVKDVFDTATRAALTHQRSQKRAGRMARKRCVVM